MLCVHLLEAVAVAKDRHTLPSQASEAWLRAAKYARADRYYERVLAYPAFTHWHQLVVERHLQ